MKVLLDTHVFLWSLLEPGRLNSKAKKLLSNSQNQLFLASISIWEILILAEKKRILLDKPAPIWIREVLSKAPIQNLPLNTEIAILSRGLQLPHQDPADRFIAATAQAHELSLLTADRHLLGCQDVKTQRAN